MKNNWIVNASPLILLAKVQQLALIVRLSEHLIIPAAVVREVQRGPDQDPAISWLHGEGARHVVPDPPTNPAIEAWNLGEGETAVLNWALQHNNYEAILDDRAARKCAQANGILYRGTLGIILSAKKSGLIRAARPVCDQLVEAGL